MIRRGKKLIALTIAASLIGGNCISVFGADNDAWTEGSQTGAAANGAWKKWVEEWETVKQNPTQMSLTPGRNSSELNFAWYSKNTEAKPQIKISKNSDMSEATLLEVTTQTATEGYISNKAVAKNLEESTNYYYSYEVNGEWVAPVKYENRDSSKFSFMYVGDPQIGSSVKNVATGETSAQGQDAATRNDSFNWNNTINTALRKNPELSFVVSAGDQIQSRDKKKPSQFYKDNEIEYAGYLSPKALTSLPVATTIGNHDAPSGNYSFHFNNPNASELGKTEAGGDYYFRNGNSLFIMLNTNNSNMAEHRQLVEKAVNENKDAKWKIVTLHQDIYGSGEHSNEPTIANLRYNLIPIFEDNDIDVVLTGHDHTYSRSLIMKGGAVNESTMISDDDFDEYFEGIKPVDDKYKNYLDSIEDKNAIKDVTMQNGNVVDPDGILYMTANSASGSKYYGLVEKQQAYIASRWQENVPTYSTVDIDEVSFTINTYRTDNGEKIDNTYTIVKEVDKSNLVDLIKEAEVKLNDKVNYTTGTFETFEKALVAAKKVEELATSTEKEIADALTNLKVAMNDLVKKGDKTELNTLIASAEELANKAVVGTGKGEYKQEVKDALLEAIKVAKETVEFSDATQEDVAKAIEVLNNALDTFKASVNGEVVKPTNPTNPTNPTDTTKPTKPTKPTTDKTPQTGDKVNVVPVLTATLASLASLCGIVFLKKKRVNKEAK